MRWTIGCFVVASLLGCSQDISLGSHSRGLSGAVCTPGADQTCNGDPAISSLWGHCESDGTCSCSTGFAVDPATGKCAPEVHDGGSAPVCTPGQDQTCNADPAVSALWGHCKSDSTCSCSAGFVVNANGKCEPSAIDAGTAPVCPGKNPAGCLADADCATNELCYPSSGVCRSSACTCDVTTRTWACTPDCSGGFCAPKP